MVTIKPFKALRPQPEFAKQVASRPYDVLNTKEAKKEVIGNPNSFLHITKSEIDFPEETDVHAQPIYDKAKQNLAAFIQRGILFQEEKPCYYIYELVMKGKSQTGLVCVSSLDDYENNRIKKHELTRPDKELDRINHIMFTGAQTGNVFLAYRNVGDIDSLIEKCKTAHHPVYNFIAPDGVGHKVWVIHDRSGIKKISELFNLKVPYTYIADGHHRAASASKARKQLGKEATENVDYFLTTLFPANQLSILDYNRVVKDLHGLSSEQFIERTREDFSVEKMPEAFSPSQLHEFGVYVGGSWYKLIAKENTFSTDPIGILDITILQNNILDKILGIKDQRTDKRIDFVGGIRGLSELEKRVNNGEMAIAISLHPVTIQQLFDIADSGNIMPPKSTWFEPKLRDGLLTHLIYE